MLAGEVARAAAQADCGLGIELEVRSENWSEDEIRAELHHVLGSSQFDASERNRRFLEYVVEETLAGRAGRIKAYNIATQVFGRDVNFDPQLDPVVRMEARRLRRSLERFYLTDGKSSFIRIAMPKGGYVPEFQNPTMDSVSKTRATRRTGLDGSDLGECGPSIMIAPFDAEGDESLFSHFNRGFTHQLIVGMSRFPEICVFEPGATWREQPAREQDRLQPDLGVDFVLDGSTALFGGDINVKAVLAHARTGRVVWAQTFERKLHSDDILQIRDDIANMITRTLAEPYGVISKCEARAAAEKGTGAFTLLDYLIRFYQYRRSYRRDLFPQVRALLEHVVVANPGCAEAYGCLSRMYSDGHRFGFASGESPAMVKERAAEFAERAIELAPDSSRGYHAKGLACWLRNDVPGSLKAMQTALALNPNATEVMAELGLFLSLLGNWERGIPFLQEAFARNPIEFETHRIGLSLHRFVNGCYDDALAEARRIQAPDVAYGFVAEAISLIRLGREADATEAVRKITEIAQRGSGAVLAGLGVEIINPALAGNIMAALRDAGLPLELMRH